MRKVIAILLLPVLLPVLYLKYRHWRRKRDKEVVKLSYRFGYAAGMYFVQTTPNTFMEWIRAISEGSR